MISGRVLQKSLRSPESCVLTLDLVWTLGVFWATCGGCTSVARAVHDLQHEAHGAQNEARQQRGDRSRAVQTRPQDPEDETRRNRRADEAVFRAEHSPRQQEELAFRSASVLPLEPVISATDVPGRLSVAHSKLKARVAATLTPRACDLPL